MKKLLVIFLVIALAISCCSCAATNTVDKGDNPDKSSSIDAGASVDNDDVSSIFTPTDEPENTTSNSEGSQNDDTLPSPQSKPSSNKNENTSDKNQQNNNYFPPMISGDSQNQEPENEVPFVPSEGISTCSHTYKAATCTRPKTCTKCGKTVGTPLGHSFKAATCTRPYECSVCGVLSGYALGHKYVLGECTVCKDYSRNYCPKLYFTGDMSQITDPAQTNKKIECNINFEYRSRGQTLDGAAKIKIQGTSSTRYVKKNYTVSFYENSNYSKELGVNVGWGAQSKYCLKANWIDKTHSRNVVSAKIAAQVQSKYGLFTQAPHSGTIDGFPVEVYINGQFHGLYTMNIPKDEWMFGMDKNNPNHIVICGENWNDPVLFKSIPTDLNDWTVEAGPENDATLQKVQRLVRFVKDSTDAEFKANFDKYLNFDSTINYYIMMTYGWLSDNAGKNMLLATYDGNVWYPTLYDLDTSWGTNWRGDGLYDYSKGVVNGSNSILWQRIEKLYQKEIATRYFELRDSILDPKNIMNEFNNFYNSIPKEVLDREVAKWNAPEHPLPGYDLSQIQDYLDTVIPRLDTRYKGWL